MGMFSLYDNQDKNYIPNNTRCSFSVGKSYTKLDPVSSRKPYEEYDAKGNLVGYFWYRGDSINLEFNIDGEIIVEDDAIILTAHKELPPSEEGKLNQRAYNISDKLSWTCTGIIDDTRIWTKDRVFTYPENGKSVYVSANDYLKDKSVIVTLYNFRMEEIYNQIFAGTTRVRLEIDKQFSESLSKGVYYCSLKVFDDNVNITVFDIKDCVLNIK